MTRRNVAGTLRVPFANTAKSPRIFYRRVTAHRPGTRQNRSPGARCVLQAFTLVEMLVAMAITLVMMGAVMTLFANITHSVRNRRATIEMTNQIRHVRNVLQQDLQGATCPGVTWQKPEANHGYIELIEGIYREGNASNLVDGTDVAGTPNFNPEINHETSILPSSNLTPFKDATGTAQPSWATDGGGLGDYDDIIMLTVRNEQEPFVGRIPQLSNKQPFANWNYESIQSPLAEVVWFAIENPVDSEDLSNFFGEPGMRTIYRRALLIAPWTNPYKVLDADGDGLVQDSVTGLTFKVEPGLVRMLGKIPTEDAIAAVVAFQARYDLSVRLEWDYSIDNGQGGWKIMANKLADLTKRENRYGHFFYRPVKAGPRVVGREYPFALVSVGSGYSNAASLKFVSDPDPNMAPNTKAKARANIVGGSVVSYDLSTNLPDNRYKAPPFVYVDDDSDTIATAQAMLNDDGQVVRVVHGPVPLSGARRGEDVMMTDVLAFDMRVYDPGAPMFATRKTGGNLSLLDLDVVLTPTDPGWLIAYMHPNNMGSSAGIGNPTSVSSITYPYIGQGAYVDMGYGYDPRYNPPALPKPVYAQSFATSSQSWFFTARALSDVYLDSRAANQQIFSQLAPGYAVYDTWSFHYENDGVNEDEFRHDGSQWQIVDSTIDEGTDGFDSKGNYADAWDVVRLGVDDVGERETAPPYDKPLRGMQVLIRTYERDSRAIRQVKVNQHFMPE